MADAEKILGTDTLRNAYPKLNQAIDNANGALTTANTAKSTADTALTNSESTQTQLDTIVINNGQSDAEVLQARVKEDGTTFPLLKDRLNDVDASLAQKLNKDESGSVTWAMASQDFREQITGGNTAVVGEDAVLTVNIVNQAVTPEKTSFLNKTVNMFDKTAITAGYTVASGGTYDSLTVSADTNVSGIIPVEPSTSYKINSALTGSGVSVRAFLSNGNYNQTLTGVNNGDGTYTITTGSLHAFIRFTYSPLILNIDTFMLVKGASLPTNYVPFGYYLPNEYINDIETRVESLESTPLPTLHVPSHLDFVTDRQMEIFDFGIIDFDDYPIPYTLNLETSSSWTQRRTNGRFLLDGTGKTPSTITKKFHLDDVNDSSVRLAEASCNITLVTPPTNPASPKNILMFGDSFMQYGDILREFDSIIHTEYSLTNYQFVGRVSKNGIKYEGTAGYDWANYVTSTDATNPFYNSAVSRLDFINYMNTNCGGVSLDYLIAVIGTNDFSHGHTIEQVDSMITTFLNQLFTDYPNCKVILVGQHRQPYASYLNSDAYMTGKGKYMIQLNKLYNDIEKRFGADISNRKVRYVDMMAQFDYDNGFTMADEPIGRFSSVTKKYITDTTHPSATVGAKYYAEGIFGGFCAINQ